MVLTAGLSGPTRASGSDSGSPTKYFKIARASPEHPAWLHSARTTGSVISVTWHQTTQWKPSSSLSLRLQDGGDRKKSPAAGPGDDLRHHGESPRRMQNCWHKSVSPGENWFTWWALFAGKGHCTPHRSLKRKKKCGLQPIYRDKKIQMKTCYIRAYNCSHLVLIHNSKASWLPPPCSTVEMLLVNLQVIATCFWQKSFAQLSTNTDLLTVLLTCERHTMKCCFIQQTVSGSTGQQCHWILCKSQSFLNSP